MSKQDLQSAVERARMVAAKITGQLQDGPMKRGLDSDDGSSAKKFASVNDAVGAQLAMFKAQQLGGGTNTSEEFKVPDKLVGLVIGKGGDQLHRLQAETQCKVVIAPDSHGHPDRVFTLIGSKENIERCKKAIDDIIKRGANPSTNEGVGFLKNNLEILEIKVPGNKCGLVIGKGGETIKMLGEKYGVKLVVVQDTSAATSGDKPLRITGEPEKVAKAKEAVLALINPQQGRYSTNDYGSKNDRNGGTSEVFIKVPGDKAGIVIGKGGESVKEINRRSGAHVEIDKNQRNSTDGSDKMFVIKGTSEQIQYAQQLIYEKITGIQGSQPPSGYFNSNDQMSQYDASGYGGAGSQQAAWANPYQQAWQQQGADPKAAAAAGGADPNAAAWAAYYQYYGQANPAAGVAGGATTGAAAATAAATTTAQPSINPQTGQPDYSQAWVEYYRSVGMHEHADAILRQTQTSGASPAAGGPASASTQGSASNSNSNSGSSSNQHQSSASGSSANAPNSQQQNGNNNGYGSWPGYSSYQTYAT